MGLIDYILNLAALLIWLSWRSIRFDPLTRRVPATLIGTLRPAESKPLRGWAFLVVVPVLLYARAVLYFYVMGPAHWTPNLDLGVVVLVFRTDQVMPLALFSLMSFLRLFAVFYFWLIALVIINRGVPETDPLQKLVTLHLGRLATLPSWLMFLVPFSLIVGLWMAIHPLLVQADALTAAKSIGHVAIRGAIVAAGLVFTLKFLLAPLLLLHLVVSYVYLGSSPAWDWISATSRNVLGPLRGMKLQFARLDFAPLAGVVLIFLLLHFLPNTLLERLANRGLTIWPQ